MGIWVEGSKLHEIGYTGDLVLYVPSLDDLVLDEVLYRVVLSIDPGTYVLLQEDSQGVLKTPDTKVGKEIMERFLVARDLRLRSPKDLQDVFWVCEQIGWFRHPKNKKKRKM